MERLNIRLLQMFPLYMRGSLFKFPDHPPTVVDNAKVRNSMEFFIMTQLIFIGFVLLGIIFLADYVNIWFALFILGISFFLFLLSIIKSIEEVSLIFDIVIIVLYGLGILLELADCECIIIVTVMAFRELSYNFEKSMKRVGIKILILVLEYIFLPLIFKEKKGNLLTIFSLGFVVVVFLIKLYLEELNIIQFEKHFYSHEKIFKKKDKLFASIIHEIRNPLSTTISCIDVLKKNVREQKSNMIIELANNSSEMAHTLITNYLDIFKMESNKLELSYVFENIFPLFIKNLGLFYTKAKDQKIELLLRISKYLPMKMKIDPIKFSQILLNLIGNAVKFTRNGTITVEVYWKKNPESDMALRDDDSNENDNHFVNYNLSNIFEPSLAMIKEGNKFHIRRPKSNESDFQKIADKDKLRENQFSPKLKSNPMILEKKASFNIKRSSSNQIDEVLSSGLDEVSPTPNIFKRKLKPEFKSQSILGEIEETKEGEFEVLSSSSDDDWANASDFETAEFPTINEINDKNTIPDFALHMRSFSLENRIYLFSKNSQESEKETDDCMPFLSARSQEQDMLTKLIKYRKCKSLTAGRTQLPSKIIDDQSLSPITSEQDPCKIQSSIKIPKKRNSDQNASYIRPNNIFISKRLTTTKDQLENVKEESDILTPRSKFSRQSSAKHFSSVSGFSGKSSSNSAIFGNISQGTLYIDIIDTGPGISQESISKLFRPFTQADSSISSKFGGTGLGLWFSKRLANLMRGDITVTSELGKGSKFSVTIPTQFETYSSFPSQNTCSGIDFVSSAGESILICEKNKEKIPLFLQTFQQLGCKPSVERKTWKAKQLIMTKFYHALFIEIRKENFKSHLDLVNEIRNIEKNNQGIRTHLCIIAASNGDNSKIEGKFQIDYYLPGPFSKNNISRIVVQLKHRQFDVIEEQSESATSLKEAHDKSYSKKSKQESINEGKPLNIIKSFSNKDIQRIENKEKRRASLSLFYTNKQVEEEEEKREGTPEFELDDSPKFSFKVPKRSSSSFSVLEALVLKILIIEDDSLIRKAMTLTIENTNFFKGFPNISILSATNGKEGFDIYRSNIGIKLVFVDSNMPIMNGEACAEKIREFEKKHDYPSAYLINLTGEGFNDFCNLGVFDDKYVKPMNSETIEKILKQVFVHK